ncbi:YHS domain-containing protein [Nonomuraea sp. M3C6]|uniref:YHS domain-containing protein n=1 Tax=Nonomuraea marmarensis TaxID=3351344 RepID=A0ABW7AVA7_9ACTN
MEAGKEPHTVTDPVCGVDVDPATAAASAERDGVTYWFCSTGCRDTFLAKAGSTQIQ